MGVADRQSMWIKYYHANTLYKYANDTEWRTVSITGAISGKITRPTSQIPNVTNIVALEIGSEVTSIGDFAFQSCINLQSVTIPSGVTSIGEQAFIGCSNLTSMTIPDGVTNIGFAAFSGCSGLTSVMIPASVTSIWDYAFDNCSKLTSMTIHKTISEVQNMNLNKWGLTNSTVIYCNDGNITIENAAIN